MKNVTRREVLITGAAAVAAAALPSIPLESKPIETLAEFAPAKQGRLILQLVSGHHIPLQEGQEKYPPMSFRIEKIFPDETNTYDSVYDILKTLPIRNIKKTPDMGGEIEKMSVQIYKTSRRGPGRTILCNSANADYIKSLKLPFITSWPERLVTIPEIPKDEYVIMYNGVSPYDAGIFRVEDGKYVTHTNYQDYMIRFRIYSDRMMMMLRALQQ